MRELRDRVAAWCTEVEAAFVDGGYAAGDHPRIPLEEMQLLRSILDTAGQMTHVTSGKADTLAEAVTVVDRMMVDPDDPWLRPIVDAARRVVDAPLEWRCVERHRTDIHTWECFNANDKRERQLIAPAEHLACGWIKAVPVGPGAQ